MIDPARTNALIDWAPALAWLQRCARVPTRLGEVWSRRDSYTETILVIGRPNLARAVNHSRVVRVLCGTRRSGWDHLVYSIDRGTRFNLNENWLYESEIGRASVWRME